MLNCSNTCPLSPIDTTAIIFERGISSLKLTGGVAQMVERSLSMREVPGSIPGTSTDVLPSEAD